MDPDQNTVPSPNVPPRATPEIGTTMPLPIQADVPVQAGPQSPAGFQPTTLTTPPTAAPGFLPPTVPVEPQSGGQAGQTPAASGQSSGATAQSAPASTGHPTAPAVADDGDLIEKEWVLKAKQIVERTRTDPHEQTKELHALKNDYMKKRYNKVIGNVDE